MSSPPPIWQTYPCHEDRAWGPKQRALVDAISALAWSTPGSPDSMTTEDAAAAVGCDTDSAWYALLDTGYALPYWPEAGRPSDVAAQGYFYSQDAPAFLRATVRWVIPEDPHTDDDDWYAFRIEESERLGRPDAVAFWTSERAQR